MPSPPTAITALAIGYTISFLPNEWLKSTMMGRFVSSFIIGIHDMSRVLRVFVSKVRIPLSHKIILFFPFFAIYSAANINSLIVALKPLFNMTVFFAFPTSFNNS